MQITTISFEENPQLLKAFREVAKAVGAKITVKNQVPKGQKLTPAQISEAIADLDELERDVAAGRARVFSDTDEMRRYILNG